jgi:hypothetical protein
MSEEKYDLELKDKMFNYFNFKLQAYNHILFISTLNLIKQIAKQLTNKELNFIIDLLKCETVNTKDSKV